jgi:hypothetical protein
MAKKIINYGDAPNAAGADSLYTAFQKTKDNFDELYSAISVNTAITNIVAGEGLTQNGTTGNVVITANIPQVEIQSTSLIMGLNNNLAGNNNVTITNSDAPLVIDIDPDIVADSINVDTANIGANLSVSGWITMSAAQTVTATGTNQATAFDIGSSLNVVTSANAGTGLKLPSTVPAGTSVYIVNQSANTISVYPPLTGTINTGIANAAVTLASNNTMVVVKATTANKWYTF